MSAPVPSSKRPAGRWSIGLGVVVPLLIGLALGQLFRQSRPSPPPHHLAERPAVARAQLEPVADEPLEHAAEIGSTVMRSPTVPTVERLERKSKPVVELSSTEDRRLDLNTASEADLQKLPGIGPVLARHIVDYRKLQRFSSVEELRKVGGIGGKKYEAIQALVKVAPK